MLLKKLKRCAVYIRVSTQEQTENYSIDAQKSRLIAYCKAHGWIIADFYIDGGYSGATTERPDLQRLIVDVQSGKIDVVLVYKLDRLSRSQKDTLYLIEDVFLANQTAFVSIQESFDTGTPFGVAMLGILAVFAQLERQNIQQRTMMGRTGRAGEGLWHGGGGMGAIGYDYIDGQLVVNEAEAHQVQRVFELYAAGSSVTDIKHKMEGYQTKFGDWSNTTTISTILENELYTGTVHFNGIRAAESHTAIISQTLFDHVQRLRRRYKRQNYPTKDSKHLLTGIIYCKRCGARYFIKKDPGGRLKYGCHSRAKKNQKMIKDANCKNKYWLKPELENKIRDFIVQHAKSPGSIQSGAMPKEEDMGRQETIEEIRSIDEEIEMLMESYKSDRLPVWEISQNISDLHQKKTLLISEIENGTGKPKKDYQVAEVEMMVKELALSWEDISISDKRRLLGNIFDRIELDGENVYFHWSF